MSEQRAGVRLVLEPEDEYCHEPEDAKTYNESMYFNAFDFGRAGSGERGFGGWFRLGNRVNEGHAEMSSCVYLPDGRVGFMFQRPRIDSNAELRAGGMHFEVVEPFEKLRVHYDGPLCLLERPAEMAEPRTAFKNNPIVPCRVELEYTGVAPMYGGRTVRADGTDLELDPENSFARAHYEQHVKAEGHVEVDGVRHDLAGFGLRDKSWGPRTWQALEWYRWLPMSFGADFGMMISVIAVEGREPRRSGMVLRDGEYVAIRDAQIESEWDADHYQTALRATARTDERSYEVTGTVRSLIPLRNRREGPDGVLRTTRITEGMTAYRCDGREGWGMSEYLDQLVDGRPAGVDPA